MEWLYHLFKLKISFKNKKTLNSLVHDAMHNLPQWLIRSNETT